MWWKPSEVGLLKAGEEGCAKSLIGIGKLDIDLEGIVGDEIQQRWACLQTKCCAKR